MHSKFLKSSVISLKLLTGLIASVLCVTLYAITISNLENRKLELVLIILPIIFATTILKNALTLWIISLVFSLSFSARFRLLGQAFHPGAELALAPMDFPLVLLALFGLFQLLQHSHPLTPSLRPLSKPIFFFLVAHLLSVIPASDPGLAWLEILRLLKMILFVWVIAYYINSRKKITFVVNILMLMIIIQGVLAISQSVFNLSFGLGFLGEHEFWTISEGGTKIDRAGGTLGHANVLANFFEILTPIGLALVFSDVKGRFRLLAKAAIPLGIIGTFLTSSRAGWVALIIGLFLVTVQFRQHIAKTRIILAVLILALVIGFIGLMFWDIVEARFTVFLGSSKIVREITAQTALNMLYANPIVGVGANNYLTVSNNYIGISSYSGLAELAAAIVHNIILLYGAELGLIGLISLGVLLLSIWRLARRIIRLGDPFFVAFAIGIIAGILSLFAHGMWDWLLRYDPVYVLFWFVVGLLVSMMNIIRRESLCHSDVEQ